MKNTHWIWLIYWILVLKQQSVNHFTSHYTIEAIVSKPNNNDQSSWELSHLPFTTRYHLLIERIWLKYGVICSHSVSMCTLVLCSHPLIQIVQKWKGFWEYIQLKPMEHERMRRNQISEYCNETKLFNISCIFNLINK